MTYALAGLSDAASAGGRFERALRLGGAAAAISELTGMAAAGEFRARHERWLNLAREALGRDRAAAAWAAGSKLELGQVVEEALSEAGPHE